MKISLIQPDQVWQDAPANRKHLGDMIAAAESADLFVLPEMFTTGFVTDPAGVAEHKGTASLEWLRDTARSKGAAIAGSVAVEEDGKYYNRFYFVAPNGEEDHYDKRHLFTMGGEKQHYTSGNEQLIVEYNGVRIMLLVCYDLRFPVWSRIPEGCDLILYTASWPAPRIEAWDTLLRARAIENQCYVAGVNRIGNDPNCVYNGHSAIIDFLGQTLASETECKESVLTAEISTARLAEFRQKFPAWMDADNFEIFQ